MKISIKSLWNLLPGRRKRKSLTIEGIVRNINKVKTLCQKIRANIKEILDRRQNLSDDFFRLYSEKIRSPVYFREVTSLEFANLKKEHDDISTLLVLESQLENDLTLLAYMRHLLINHQEPQILGWRNFIINQYRNPTPQQQAEIAKLNDSIDDLVSRLTNRQIVEYLTGERGDKKILIILEELTRQKNIVEYLDKNRIKKWEARMAMDTEALKSHLEHQEELIRNELFPFLISLEAILSRILGSIQDLQGLTGVEGIKILYDFLARLSHAEDDKEPYRMSNYKKLDGFIKDSDMDNLHKNFFREYIIPLLAEDRKSTRLNSSH